MSKLTNEQLNAVNAIGNNFIVSAAAGSGKTTVLSARVLELVKKGVSLEEILVLTFTNSAASSMKNKIRQNLNLNPLLRHLAPRVDSSYIMTFDAFALAILKKYHYVLNLSPSVSVVDESIINLVKKRFVDEIFEELYQTNNPEFINLISAYAIKSDNELKEFVLRIEKMADLKPNKIQFLSTYIDTFFSPSYIQNGLDLLKNQIQKMVLELQSQTERFHNSNLGLLVKKSFQEIVSATTFDELILAMNYFSFPAKEKGISEEDILLHKVIKNSTSKFKDWVLLGSSLQVTQRYLATKPFVTLMLDIIIKLDKKLLNFKTENNSFTFSDIAKMAMELVKMPDINKELKQTIKYIMIDEYQDTSDLQEAFISQLENKNLFMVGDIKQSIYRFRNANSEIFLNRYNQYSNNLDGIKIDMNTNFRSRREVIDDLNGIFSSIMSRRIGGIDYDKNQRLNFGLTKYENKENIFGNRNISVLRYTSDGNERNENEAKIIANDIIKKINGKFLVLDNEVTREATFKDFAILIDRKTNFETFRKVFYDFGIPLQVSMEQDFNKSDLMLVVKNLVSLVANYNNEDFIKNYTHEIMSVLRSFVYALPDQNLFNLLKNPDELTKHDLLIKVKQLNESSHRLSLSNILFEIIMVFKLEECSIRIGDVRKNSSQLEHLYHSTETMEKLGYTIQDLVSYFEDSQAYEEKISLGDDIKQTSAVQLMSIHKAKGLEFPIVYYPGFDSDFNHPETKTKFNADGFFGILFPNTDSSNPNNAFHYLASQKESEEALSEEVRKLYVALTRAKEKIIILHRDEQERILVSLSYAKSFSDFVRFTGIQNRYGLQGEIEKIQLKTKISEVCIEPIQFGRLDVPFERLEPKRFSKALQPFIDEEILSYGTHLHYLMSLVDFKTKDTLFITDVSEREKIAKVLKNDLFLNSKLATVSKEYPFFDLETKSYGIIDLILAYENEWHIIDYKTSNLDDQGYEEQLNSYARYLSTVTTKPLRLFLVAIETREIKEIPFRRKI